MNKKVKVTPRVSTILRFGLFGMLVALLTSCISRDVDLAFDEDLEILESQQAEGRLSLGHFGDRRGKGDFWIGDIPSILRYPKTILTTREPVTSVVRSIVTESAERRGLLSRRGADADLQLSGEVLTLEGTSDDPAAAFASIMFRLTTLDGSEQVYQKLHRIYLESDDDDDLGQTVDQVLEEALNTVIARALDAEAFRAKIEASSDI